MRCVLMSMRLASRVRSFRLFFRAARTGGVSLDVFLRRGLELGFAAGAAEQHVFAISRQPMRRIRFDDHAADGVAQISAWVSIVSMMMAGLGVHVVLASSLALLISLAAEPAPSHNGKVNTENSVLIP